MNTLREFLQNGTLRKHATKFIFSITFIASLIISVAALDSISADIQSLDKVLRLFGFFAALLAALSHKLREKNISYYLKCLLNDAPIHDPITTGRGVTNLTLLSFVTSGSLIITSCIPCDVLKICILTPICLGLCAMCVVQYIYLLFEIEKFEEEVIAAVEKSYVKKNSRNS